MWDYPRPPVVEPVSERLRVVFGGQIIAQTESAVRVIETAGAPVYYFPREAVHPAALVPTAGSTSCEWKGHASYFDVVVGDRRAGRAAFTYPNPSPRFVALASRVAFYARPMDACYVGNEKVRPQPGAFYAGWMTSKIVGPVKGEAWSEGW